MCVQWCGVGRCVCVSVCVCAVVQCGVQYLCMMIQDTDIKTCTLRHVTNETLVTIATESENF